jgi:pimeloyl-ACP methyl ester carboxylesterase
MVDWITVPRNDAAYRLPYCFQKGNGGRALLFVHGFAKENFCAAFQSPALADYDLLAFDFPGAGVRLIVGDSSRGSGAVRTEFHEIGQEVSK